VLEQVSGGNGRLNAAAANYVPEYEDGDDDDDDDDDDE
jgi:hypothetical protein